MKWFKVKDQIGQLAGFIRNNWFRLAILVAIFWFLSLLQNGIEIEHEGRVDVDHTGWIENEKPWLRGLPKLP